MTPEREIEIRKWVKMRYGVDCQRVFNAMEEVLKELDRVKEELHIANCELRDYI